MAKRRFDLGEQERQLIEILREWGGEDDHRVSIEFHNGAWQIGLTTVLRGKTKVARGVGRTFAEAWDNTVPTWA